jgi:hypothetical protein
MKMSDREAQVIKPEEVKKWVEIRQLINTMLTAGQLVRNLGGKFDSKTSRPQLGGEVDVLNNLLNSALSEILCVVQSDKPEISEDDETVTIAIQVANTGVSPTSVRAWLATWDGQVMREFEGGVTLIDSGQIVEFTFPNFPRSDKNSRWFTFYAEASPVVKLKYDVELNWKKSDVRPVSFTPPPPPPLQTWRSPNQTPDEFRDPNLTND